MHSPKSPDAWWRGIVEASRRVMTRGAVHADEITAVAVTSQWSGTVPIDRDGLESAIVTGLARIEKAIADTVADAGLDKNAIQAVFLTGGSSAIPIVRAKISQFFPNAAIRDGDMFGSVGKGLGLDAYRKFR